MRTMIHVGHTGFVVGIGRRTQQALDLLSSFWQLAFRFFGNQESSSIRNPIRVIHHSQTNLLYYYDNIRPSMIVLSVPCFSIVGGFSLESTRLIPTPSPIYL